jgi:ribosomal protein S16
MYDNCIHCGTLTHINSQKSCESCQKEDNQLLQQAREFIRTNGRKSIFELAEALKITPARIFRWIEQGRMPSQRFKYLCPKCGQDLMKGLCACNKQTLRGNENTGSKGFHSKRRVEQKCKKYWEEDSRINRRQKRDIWLLTK